MIIPAALIAVIAVMAGCVGQFPGLPGFGSEVIKPSFAASSLGVVDVVAIEGIQTLPAGTVLPDQPLRLFMNIISKDTDPLKSIQNVGIKLFDASVFKGMGTGIEIGGGTGFCNELPSGCEPEERRCADFDCVLQAGETKSIIFNIKAPSAAEIANILTKATLSWFVRYAYTGTTNYDVLLVSEQEVLRLQQAGQTLNVPLQSIQGSGPVKIDMSTPTSFSITTSTTTPPDIFLVIKLRNSGSGTIKNNKITQGNLKISIPNSLGTVNPGDYFVAQGTDAAGNPTYANARDIEFIKKETIPMQIRITPTQLYDVPHRTFQVNANVQYEYELRNSVTIDIRPPQLT
jgi:hypothetical protein